MLVEAVSVLVDAPSEIELGDKQNKYMKTYASFLSRD